MRRLDLAGLKFGSLTAMAPVGKSEKGHILWKCVCACGKEIEAKAGDLRAGHRTSCGCGRIRDLSGQRFGHLLAVRLVEMNKHGAAMWECQCDCGALKVISSPHLLKGITKRVAVT